MSKACIALVFYLFLLHVIAYNLISRYIRAVFFAAV